MTHAVLERPDLKSLFNILQRAGYTTIAPTVRDNVITYENVTDQSELPIGMTDDQKNGSYRLKKRKDKSVFGFVVGPQSWKKFLYPARLKLWEAHRNGKSFSIAKPENEEKKLAFIGVRPCEMSAISIQDKVFLKSTFADPAYSSRREQLFTVIVNCTEPGGTCFCTSMDTGPRAKKDYDLALTEVVKKDQHYFLVEIGSDQGKEIANKLPLKEASEEQVSEADKHLNEAARKMGKALKTDGVKDLLYENAENPHWEKVAERCMTCANCTMVCPTCFCSTMEDSTDLSGEIAERWRTWDSCFTMDFSYVHGGSIRNSSSARYRQWLTHKLGSWQDQFGTSGCVGCGRCITWCPVGIDITEEIKTLQECDSRKSKSN